MLCQVFLCFFVTFPYGVPGQVWYLKVISMNGNHCANLNTLHQKMKKIILRQVRTKCHRGLKKLIHLLGYTFVF